MHLSTKLRIARLRKIVMNILRAKGKHFFLTFYLTTDFVIYCVPFLKYFHILEIYQGLPPVAKYCRSHSFLVTKSDHSSCARYFSAFKFRHRKLSISSTDWFESVLNSAMTDRRIKRQTALWTETRTKTWQ